jgi:hypothetical protein
LIMLSIMMFIVVGCGVKPRQVDAPNGQPSHFPRTYPQPEPTLKP